MNTDFDFLPPPAQPRIPENFQADVLQRIRKDQLRKQILTQGAVFCLVALSSYGWMSTRHHPMKMQTQPTSPRVTSAQNGVDWLLQAQNPEGGWSAEHWGGHSQFSVGVSALATLALLNSPEPVDPAAMDAAIALLEQHLAWDVSLTSQGPQFYNFILNLHTLAEVQRQRPSANRQMLLQQAYSHLLRNQQSDGGWGYLDQNPLAYQNKPDANTAVTWWVCHLLRNRPAFPLPGAENALAKGQHWLDLRVQPSGEIAYQSGNVQLAGPEAALFWMASPLMAAHTQLPENRHDDAYRDFFRIRELRNDDLLEPLQAQQQASGAWENDADRWWRAGGKVYLTAMSVLTQVPRPPSAPLLDT